MNVYTHENLRRDACRHVFVVLVFSAGFFPTFTYLTFLFIYWIFVRMRVSVTARGNRFLQVAKTFVQRNGISRFAHGRIEIEC